MYKVLPHYDEFKDVTLYFIRHSAPFIEIENYKNVV